MNQELQNALVKLLNQISNAGHVMANQLPDVLRQLIAYNIFLEWVLIFLFAGLSVFLIFVAKWCYRNFKAHSDLNQKLFDAYIKNMSGKLYRPLRDGEEQQGTAAGAFAVAAVICGFGSVGLAIALITRLVVLVQLEFMPKAWLISYIRGAIGH